MARDNQDKQTRNLPLSRRGRPAKLASGAMSAAERKQAERARRKERGEVQMWLTPDEVAAVEAMRADNSNS